MFVEIQDQHESEWLRPENADLERADGILKAATVLFAAELDRPQR